MFSLTLKIFSFLLIGPYDHFGFGFTTLSRKALLLVKLKTIKRQDCTRSSPVYLSFLKFTHDCFDTVNLAGCNLTICRYCWTNFGQLLCKVSASLLMMSLGHAQCHVTQNKNKSKRFEIFFPPLLNQHDYHRKFKHMNSSKGAQVPFLKETEGLTL